jgi:hypothetical protein
MEKIGSSQAKTRMVTETTIYAKVKHGSLERIMREIN